MGKKIEKEWQVQRLVNDFKEKIEVVDQKDEVVKQDMMKTYSFCWPYTCFQGIYDQFLYILNSFDGRSIFRVEFDKKSQDPYSHF